MKLYSGLQRALNTCRSRSPSRYLESLEKDVANQEIVFREFLHVLLPVGSRAEARSPQATRPNSIRSLSQASQGSIIEPAPPYAVSLNEESRGYSAFGAFRSYLRGAATLDAVPWHDLGSHASLEKLFAPEKAQIVLEILEEIRQHLRAMEIEVSNHTTSRRGWFGTTFPPSRNSRRDSNPVSSSSLPDRLSHLHQLNKRLGRLSEDPRLPSESTPAVLLQTQQSTSHREIDAEDVYHAIKTSYHCECDRPHPTKLGLPQIGAVSCQTSRSNRQFPRPSTGFSVLFSTDDGILPEILDDSLSLVASTESLRTHPRTSSHSLQRFESLGTLTTQDDHEKRFSGMMSSVDSGTTLNSSNTRSSRPKSCAVTITECNTDGPEIIRDLCDTVRALSENSSPRPATTIGVLRSKKRKRYSLQTLKSPENPSSRDIISLEDIFASNQSKLSRKDRIMLALRLSHAVLCFYSTPWISESWSWRDFSMSRAENSQDDCQLFVSHDFYSTEQAIEEREIERPATSDFLQIYVGEPSLTRLGFALTELAIGKRLAELRTEEERQIQDAEMQDYRTAKRILKSGLIRDEENERYEDIVKVCLTHQFRSKEMQLRCLNSEEPSFQADAEQLIVAPLYGAWTRDWPSSIAQAVY